MGYCLLSIGAETPNEMSKVQAVCIHRSYGLENIEGLYCELTNLASHTVEFLHFGQGKPMEPIFSAGTPSSPIFFSSSLLLSLPKTPDANASRFLQVTMLSSPARLSSRVRRSSASASA